MMKSALFHYIKVPVVEMRLKPSPRAEVASQAFFSERIRPLEEYGEWIKIETLSDDYQGWINSEAFFTLHYDFFSDLKCTIASINRSAAHLYAEQDTIYGPMLTLPFESILKLVEAPSHSDSRWLKVILPDQREGFIQRGDVRINPSKLHFAEICRFSLRFLGLPYTWGGRSSFGYDCSGFIQMLYRQMGIYLPRDAKDQFLWEGFTEVSLESTKPGNLIFFGFSKDKIRHVGMCLGEKKFIHACASVGNAPYIRIDCLDDLDWNGSGYYPYAIGRKAKKK